VIVVPSLAGRGLSGSGRDAVTRQRHQGAGVPMLAGVASPSRRIDVASHHTGAAARASSARGWPSPSCLRPPVRIAPEPPSRPGKRRSVRLSPRPPARERPRDGAPQPALRFVNRLLEDGAGSSTLPSACIKSFVFGRPPSRIL